VIDPTVRSVLAHFTNGGKLSVESAFEGLAAVLCSG